MPPRKKGTKQEAEPERQDETAQPVGDEGKREAEVASAIERLGKIADEINLGEDDGAIMASGTAAVIELFKHRPKPWGQMSQFEQRDVGQVVEGFVRELIRQIAEAVRANGKPAIRAMLESYNDKDGVKAILKVRPSTPEEELAAVIGLHQAKGKIVLITVASADDFARTKPKDQSVPDQPGLGFEAGTDQHPDDDSDLVDAADETAPAGAPAPEFAETGKQMLVPGQGLCEIRINLKTGMIEAKLPGADEFEIDVREATSVELAAERDRIADFADDGANDVGAKDERTVEAE